MGAVTVDDNTAFGWLSPTPNRPPDVSQAIDNAPQPPPADYASANQALNYGANNAAPETDASGNTWDSATQSWSDNKGHHWTAAGGWSDDTTGGAYTNPYGSDQNPTYFDTTTGQYTGPLTTPASEAGYGDQIVQRAHALNDYMSQNPNGYNEVLDYLAPPQGPGDFQPDWNAMYEPSYNLNFPSPLADQYGPRAPGDTSLFPAAPYVGDRIYQNPDTGGVTFSPDFQQYNNDTGNFQPVDQYPFDPNRSYAPGTAYDAMANHPSEPGFLDSLQSAAGDTLHMGLTGLGTVLNAPVNFATGPAAAQLYGDVTGNVGDFLSSPENIGMAVGGLPLALAGLATQTVSDYGSNRKAYQDFEQNPDVNPYLKAGAVTALNPLSYLGGGTAALTNLAFNEGNVALAEYGQHIPGWSSLSPDVQQAIILAVGPLIAKGAEWSAPKVQEAIGRAVPKVADAYTRTPLASEEGSVSLGSRFHLSTPDTSETGTRPGSLLQPKGVEQLPENYTPKDVLGVAGDLNRQVNSQANTLRAEAENALNVMGDRYKASDGNVYFKDIPASPVEASIGKPNALAVRVLERPQEYNLTPEQAAAVNKLAAIPEAVKNERAVFGVKPNEIALDEGQNYFHRTAISPAIERPGQEAEISALANGGSTKGVKDLLAYRESSGGSSRLAIGKDKGRIVADPIDFVKRGGVYADPLQALDQNVAQGLSKAANAHIKGLLEPFAQTAADRVSPEFRTKVDTLRNRVASLDARLTTAEGRIDRNMGTAKELQRPLDRLQGGVVDRATARGALNDAQAELRAAQRDALQTARKAGGAVAKDQAAKADFAQAQARADAALQRLRDAQKKVAGLGEVTPTGMDVRLPAISQAAAEAAVKDAELSTAELRRLAGKVKMPIGANAKSEATTAARGLAETATRETTAQLRDATATALQAAKDVAPDSVHSAITNIQKRIDVLQARGGKAFTEADSLGKQLSNARSQLDEILPEWRKAQEIARSIPNDRAAVDSRLAPALIGSDFERNTAKQIERFYGRTSTSDVTQIGRLAIGIRTLNTALIPGKATMDLSALLNQQGRMLVMHPKAYVTNFARSLRDVVNPTEYNKLLSSAPTKEAASRGLSILGEAGSKNEFQFNNWFEHIPGVGKVAQAANRQFTTFNNRMRLTAFDDWKQAASAAGKPLDAAGEEQLATALNRMTGISKTRAGDLEQLAFFAPNFLRSHIENIGASLGIDAPNGVTSLRFNKGLATGVEGQVARRYLGTTFAVGTSLVAGAAMAQGRDPSEVLSPFDLKALKNGELRWNSNFGTIRVGGQDVQVYGPYTSLARLAAVATTGALDSMKEKDARPFLAALMDIPSTKGSPAVRFAVDAVKGQTYAGNSPTDFSPGGIANGLADMALPISIANVIQDKQKGLSWHDTILDSVLNAVGANSNPMTAYESRDDQARAQYGKAWSDLSPQQQNALKAVKGSAAATYESTNPDAVAAKQRQADDRQYLVQQQTGNDDLYRKPGTNLPKTATAGRDWRDEYHKVIAEQQAMLDKENRDHPYTGPQSNDPTRRALNERSDFIKNQATTGSVVDWQKVDLWAAQHPEQQKLIDAYYADPNKPKTDMTPMVTQYKQDSKALGDAGIFDIRDKAWQAASKNNAQWKQYATFDDYLNAKRATLEAKYGQLPNAETIVNKVLSNDPGVKVFDVLRKNETMKWVSANPKLARTAAIWGFLTPNKAEQAIIDAAGAGQ